MNRISDIIQYNTKKDDKDNIEYFKRPIGQSKGSYGMDKGVFLNYSNLPKVIESDPLLSNAISNDPANSMYISETTDQKADLLKWNSLKSYDRDSKQTKKMTNEYEINDNYIKPIFKSPYRNADIERTELIDNNSIEDYKGILSRELSDITSNLAEKLHLNKVSVNNLMKDDLKSNIVKQKVMDMWKKIEDSEAKQSAFKNKMTSTSYMFCIYFIIMVLTLIISYKVFSKKSNKFYNNLGYCIIILFFVFYLIQNFDYLWNNYIFKLINSI